MNENIYKNSYEEILDRAKYILKAIEARGYKAYIVSETVRKIILKQEASIGLIASNIPFELINTLFSNYETYLIDSFNIAINFEGVPFIIKKFFKENSNGIINESDNLNDFLDECDFTINALAMDSKTDIIDNYYGYDDIKKGRVGFVDLRKKKLLKYPFRALELLNLVEEGFIVKNSSINLIKRTRPLKGISLSDISNNLNINNIICGNNSKYILKVIKKTDMYKDIPVFGYELLNQIKKNENLDSDTFIAKALIRSYFNETLTKEDFDKALEFAASPVDVKHIFEVAISLNEGHYSKISLLNAGKELALKANHINKALKNKYIKDNKIIKDFDSLIIKSPSEIKYYNEEILHDFRNMSLSDVENVLEVIKIKILDQELLNDYYEIQEFVSNYLINNNKKEQEEKDEIIEENIEKKDYSFSPNNRENFIKENYERVEREENNFNERELLNLYKTLEKETDEIVNILVRGLDITSSEKEVVKEELKEAYKNILIRNTSKYARLK